jgi:hypothetical protein
MYNALGGQDLTWKSAAQMAEHLVSAATCGLERGLHRWDTVAQLPGSATSIGRRRQARITGTSGAPNGRRSGGWRCGDMATFGRGKQFGTFG